MQEAKAPHKKYDIGVPSQLPCDDNVYGSPTINCSEGTDFGAVRKASLEDGKAVSQCLNRFQVCFDRVLRIREHPLCMRPSTAGTTCGAPGCWPPRGSLWGSTTCPPQMWFGEC